MEQTTTRLDSLKVTVIGNVDAGKTTLVGVLTKGIPDNGRGSARENVFNFTHEKQNGRTSSIAPEIIGFDKDGKQVLPERFNQNKNRYWAQVVEKSTKVVTILDLCGHEKYLKTTMFGLAGMDPDYSVIVVGSNMGVSRITREHLGISLALKIPFFVVLTKIDISPQTVYDKTLADLQTLLKSQEVNKRPIVVQNTEEIAFCAENMPTGTICPIFSCSAITKQGIDNILAFMSQVKPRNIRNINDKVEFDINETFLVKNVGFVVSGVVKAGLIKPNMTLLLGPDKLNTFKPVQVRSIHLNRVMAEEAAAGQYACLSIKPMQKGVELIKKEFRKGMILLDSSLEPQPIWEFEGNVVVLHHATSI